MPQLFALIIQLHYCFRVFSIDVLAPNALPLLADIKFANPPRKRWPRCADNRAMRVDSRDSGSMSVIGSLLLRHVNKHGRNKRLSVQKHHGQRFWMPLNLISLASQNLTTLTVPFRVFSKPL
jgi:hypothetical protein